MDSNLPADNRGMNVLILRYARQARHPPDRRHRPYSKGSRAQPTRSFTIGKVFKMIASLEDAQLLFHGWEQHSRLIQIKLMSSSLIFHGVGSVVDSSRDALRLGGD